MSFLLSLGFVFVCKGNLPGKDHGILLLDHPVMAKYLPIKAKCWVDV